jgi:hypothetical protein
MEMHMKNIYLKLLLLGTTMELLFLVPYAHAGIPLWTFTPLTATAISVSKGGTATIQYQVTNQSKKTHTLFMKGLTGINQETSSGHCAHPFTLGYQQSCVLTLTVNGLDLQSNVIGGPVVCQQDSNLQCYQPSQSTQLNIQLTNQSPTPPATQYTNIYAQTANYRIAYSFNNGNTWNPMINQQSSWYWNALWGQFGVPTASMTVDAQGVMYQAVQTWNEGASGCVIYSQDGVTWNLMNVAFPSADTGDVNIVATLYNNTLYVSTLNGYILSTSNQGMTWVTLNQGNVLDGAGISALITDDHGTVYAGAGSGFIYYSTNQGNTWNQAAASPSPGNAITNLAVTNTNGRVTWYASTVDNNTYYSINQGQTWMLMNITWPPTDSGDSVTVFSASNNVLYAGTTNGYVFTLQPSGTNMWNATQQSAPIDGTSIKVLTVTQGILSPLFVEGMLGSNTNPQALPVNGAATLTVTNYSQNVANDVHLQSLSAGLTQTPGTDCASVVPYGTCTINLRATEPFAPQNIAIIGSNTSVPIEHLALVSSMNNYLVYNVNAASSPRIAYVVDNADAPNSPALWGADDGLGISETSTNPCNAATDGYCNTGVILQPTYTSHAAPLCAAKNTNPSFPGGTFTPNWWYLPSLCELGNGLYGVSGGAGSSIHSCNTVPTGIFSLYGLGYLSDLNSIGNYWSSTEANISIVDFAWFRFFTISGSGYQYPLGDKNGSSYGVRCVQGFAY